MFNSKIITRLPGSLTLAAGVFGVDLARLISREHEDDFQRSVTAEYFRDITRNVFEKGVCVKFD